MTLKEIMGLLKKTGYEVAYGHFRHAPKCPYISVISLGSDNFFSDNHTYFKNQQIEIELYTDTKDLLIEENIEKILDENNISWNKTESFIPEENLFQIAYSIYI
jgi:hypothetical protein